MSYNKSTYECNEPDTKHFFICVSDAEIGIFLIALGVPNTFYTPPPSRKPSCLGGYRNHHVRPSVCPYVLS